MKIINSTNQEKLEEDKILIQYYMIRKCNSEMNMLSVSFFKKKKMNIFEINSTYLGLLSSTKVRLPTDLVIG